MNKRNSSTACCGTCENWIGERRVLEKEDYTLNEIKVFVECERNGFCSKKNEEKCNGKKCIHYVRWNEMD